MSKLLILQGLPASGKSTYAKELVAQGWVRVNKDDLRAMLHDGKFSRSNEEEVLTMRDAIIEESLYADKNVVVDDTNFHEKHINRLREIAEQYSAEFEIKFIDTPLEECISRNERRANKVPVGVIVDMYNRYIYKEKKVEYNDDLEEAILVDVDGTLAHMCDRNPYDASLALGDSLDDAVDSVVAMAYGHGYKIIILTGRHSGHLQVTKDWLRENGVNYDKIYCRAEGDNRPDTEIKKELYEEHIKDKYNVKFIIDDRPSVCRMWRNEGLKVFQVGDPHHEF